MKVGSLVRPTDSLLHYWTYSSGALPDLRYNKLTENSRGLVYQIEEVYVRVQWFDTGIRNLIDPADLEEITQ